MTRQCYCSSLIVVSLFFLPSHAMRTVFLGCPLKVKSGFEVLFHSAAFHPDVSNAVTLCDTFSNPFSDKKR